ncbi:MAG: response regulator [Bacteroidota bacterium]
MGSKLVVMIIDDDAVNNTVCSLIINRAQFAASVSTFLRASDALASLRESMKKQDTLPDIIFLDINMPVMNGWDFLDEFTPMIPLLPKPIMLYMLSSSVYHEDVSKARAYPIVRDYLPKPLTANILNRIREEIEAQA